MKALIYKELAYGLRYFWIFALFSVLAFVFALFGGPIHFGIMASIMFGLFGNSVYAYEEKSRFNSYISALPFSDTRIVSAKYTASIMVTVVNALFITLGTVLNICVMGKISPKITVMDPILIPVSLMLYIIVGLAWNIVMPIAYRFGSERSRWVFCVLGGVCGALFSLTMNLELTDIAALMENILLILGVVLGVILLLVAGSWWLSIKVYKKREL